MLWLLERHELTVSELCTVLQLPQSTVSRHLRMLSDADWVTLAPRRHEPVLRAGARWRRRPARADLGADARAGRRRAPAPTRTSAGSRACSPSRREASQQFFATSAGQWDRLRDELFGRDFVPGALLGLLPSHWIVGDLGCGTGALLPTLAPHVARVIGVDASDEMLGGRARARQGPRRTSSCAHGTLEALPLDDASLDAVTLMLVLHHLPAPADALAEAAPRAQARRPAAHRRHDAARARGIPAAHGPRLARILRRSDAHAALTQAGLRGRPHSRAAAGDADAKGPSTLRRERRRRQLTTSN